MELTSTSVGPSGVVFTFPPLGWQRCNMGRCLYHHNAIFRAAVDDCASCCDPLLPQPLVAVLYPDDAPDCHDPLLRPTHALPAIFAVEYGLYALCVFDACTPCAVVGHSLGEFVAAVAAGVLTLPVACALVCARAVAMDAMPPLGSMVSLKYPVELAHALIAATDLESRVVIACACSPLVHAPLP